jgi:hypothetical protein
MGCADFDSVRSCRMRHSNAVSHPVFGVPRPATRSQPFLVRRLLSWLNVSTE